MSKSLATRIIPRLDIKAPNLVKGIKLEGLRKIGDPAEHALRYYEQGADELLYIDIVASLYERNSLADLIARTAEEIFVPLTVGGGIRTLDDVHALLRAGAEKVAINTGAIRTPALIQQIADKFGSQCAVVSIEAQRRLEGVGWEAFTDNGREKTGVDAVEWAQRAVELGAGELLITSVDQEGTRSGFDLELIAAIGPHVSVPVIACGGAGSPEDIAAAVAAGADAVALAAILHYGDTTLPALKADLSQLGLEIR